jgi:hypothetical protein
MEESKRKRPPRVPLDPEVVAGLVWQKQIRQEKNDLKFRQSSIYKYCNVFAVIAVFIYCELLLCYFFTTNNTKYAIEHVVAYYGDTYKNGQRIISSIEINKTLNVRVNDFIEIPKTGTLFKIGRDYILKKDLVCLFSDSKKSYSIVRSEPILFLSFFVMTLTLLLTYFNQNQKSYSLKVMTLINILSLLLFMIV